MDAIFLEKIRGDYPKVRFVLGDRFSFRPPKTVVFCDNPDDTAPLLLLHELGHFLTGCFDFTTEVERLKIEVMAWEKARELAPLYGVFIDEDLIESELDSYRDFLHQKSRCPSCGLTRFQTPDKIWYCPKCDL
ncbi:hypothetical protein IKF94_00780 [Candidatus Saccharibacteria bacterium]|nr:hypothetical protein [Candidatus Saccharibacteria bacterium]